MFVAAAVLLRASVLLAGDLSFRFVFNSDQLLYQYPTSCSILNVDTSTFKVIMPSEKPWGFRHVSNFTYSLLEV